MLLLGNAEVPADGKVSKVRVRFRNDGGKAVARAELHLGYQLPRTDATEVTFARTDDTGDHTARQVMTADKPWRVPTGKNVKTKWVEFRPVAGR